MGAMLRQTFRQDTKKLGSYRSWWLPANPVDGEYWWTTVLAKGESRGSTHRRSPDGVYREGGPWIMEKVETIHAGATAKVYRYNNYVAYEGAFRFSDSFNQSFDAPSDYNVLVNRAYAFGAQAMLALRPDKPDMSIGLSLLELKDPFSNLKHLTATAAERVRKEQRRRARKARSFGEQRYWLSQQADTYLTIMFGLMPLVRDIGGYLDTLGKGDKRFKQLIRDEGRSVYRRRELLHLAASGTYHNSSSTTTAGNTALGPILVSQCYAPGIGITGTWNDSRRVWCAGRSRYMLPPGPRDAAWLQELAERMLGARMGASTAYNLTPWTFVVDYFTDLGTFVEACDPAYIADKLVFEYAYIMDTELKTSRDVGYQHCYTGKTGPATKVEATRYRITTRKARVSASVFGWGFSQETLSPAKMGILGALGLSRL